MYVFLTDMQTIIYLFLDPRATCGLQNGFLDELPKDPCELHVAYDWRIII